MFKVLIAEDEPPIMRMIKSTLESVDSGQEHIKMDTFLWQD